SRLPRVCAAEADIEDLVDFLDSGERTTLLCGAGCAGAHDAVVALAAKLKAPIVHAMRGKEHIEWDNPYDVGMTGLIGFSSGYHAMEACDTLLMLGTDFPYRQFYPTKARIPPSATTPKPGRVSTISRTNIRDTNPFTRSWSRKW